MYKTKYNIKGKVEKLKARIVAWFGLDGNPSNKVEHNMSSVFAYITVQLEHQPFGY
jgi:hypothetical protein